MIKADMSLNAYERYLFLEDHKIEVLAETEARKIRNGVIGNDHCKTSRLVKMEMAGLNYNEFSCASFVKHNGTPYDIQRAKLGYSLNSLYVEIKARKKNPVLTPVPVVEQIRFENTNNEIAPVIMANGDEFGIADFKHELDLRNEEIVNGFKRVLRVHSDLDNKKSKPIVCNTIDLLIEKLTALKGDLLA